MNLRTIILLALLLSGSGIGAQSQQVKQTGAVSELPLKTVVINESAADQDAEFWNALTILRFSVCRAGSMADVQKIMETFRGDGSVKHIKEGPVTGDNKEFVLTLHKPQSRDWYLKKFREAGLTHVKINNARPEKL